MFRLRLLTIAVLTLALVSCSANTSPKVAKTDSRDDPYFDFVDADLLAMKGETQKSTAELLKLSDKYPKMAFFRYLLAQNFGQERRIPEAVEACKQAIEIEPGFIDARVYLGKLYAATENHAEAVSVLSGVVHDDPKREEVYPLLANEYVVMKEPRRALETMRRLIVVNPDSVVAYYYVGQIEDRYLKNQGAALAAYREALSVDPTNSSIHNAIAEIHLQRKQLRLALAKYEELAHYEPDDVAVQLRIALIHYELKEFDKAIGVFQAIVKKNPAADKIRYYLGVLYENSKEPRRAIEELSAVPLNSSFYKDARLHMAAMLRQAGKNDEAVAVLREGIAQKDKVEEFYGYLAALYEEMKEYPEAIAVLEEGRKQLPDDEKLVFLLAILYEKVKDRDRAVGAMREVLRINPKNAGALNYIGYTWADRGENLEEALNMIQQALVLRPEDGFITDSLGWAYFKMGDDERAWKYLTRANRAVPGEPTILDHLGEVLMKRGDTKGALRYFEQAVEAGAKKPEPDEEELARIREKIEKLKSQ